METNHYDDGCVLQTESSILTGIQRNMDQMSTPDEESEFNHELSVLIIDDDIVCLKVLSRCLRKCKYKVKATTKAEEALEILRKKEEIYDIVITDVKMNDQMDGFQLLEIIGLEMDIPVIMISGSGDKEWVMKGIRHGARDYLVKPARMDKLQNIWQHVVRKNMFDPNNSKSRLTRVESADNSMIMNALSVTKSVIDGESCPPKKPRVNWTKILHNKFIDAIEILGADAFPKKILELMNEPNLSRENVASHLQKYRKWLKKGKKGSSSTVSQDKILNDQRITNVVNTIDVAQPPLQTFINPSKNQFLIQQNQQLTPTYGNYFHQAPVFTPNPSLPWNRSFGFSPTINPNQSLVPCIDSKYAVFGNGNPSPNNNYVGIHQPFVSYPNNSYDVPNFQVTISQPAPINIHTNPIIMASNGPGNMTGFDAPRLDEQSSLNVGGSNNNNTYVENEWIPNGQLMYQQQQLNENESETDIPVDDDLSAMMKEFNNSEPPVL